MAGEVIKARAALQRRACRARPAGFAFAFFPIINGSPRQIGRAS